MSKQAKRKRRRGGGGGKKKSGVLMGMRSGFKGAANVVTGKEAPKSGRAKLISTLTTVALIALAAYLVYNRFLK